MHSLDAKMDFILTLTAEDSIFSSLMGFATDRITRVVGELNCLCLECVSRVLRQQRL